VRSENVEKEVEVAMVSDWKREREMEGEREMIGREGDVWNWLIYDDLGIWFT
jgi:hypothetical protein